MKPIRGGLLLIVGIVATMLVVPATSWAAYPGANGLIAYSETRGYYNSEIFTISPSGGIPTQLTDSTTPDAQPSWSADGRRMVFVRRVKASRRNWEVWTMRADGGHQRQVTHDPAYEASPSFSPGGGRILMIRNGNVAIVGTDGTGLVKLTRGHRATDPGFSPDGRRIVFAGAPRKEGRLGIWVMRRDGTHRQLLANAGPPEEGVELDGPDFSPDGSHILYARCLDEGHQCPTDDFIMRSNGRHKRIIQGAEGEAPVFSPDGARIAIIRLYSCTFDLYCWAGSKVVTLARNGTDAQVVTQPDATADSYFNFDTGPSWQPIPAP